MYNEAIYPIIDDAKNAIEEFINNDLDNTSLDEVYDNRRI